MTEVLILDVSDGVGDIDFGAIAPHVTGEKLPQVHGAIVRLTEGNIFDMRYHQNYDGFRSIGLPVGGYGWHNPSDSATSNKAQANKLLAAVDSLGEYPALGVWADYESDPKNLTIEQMRQAIWKYITTFEAGVDEEILGIYTRKAWWDANVANATNGYSDIPAGGRLLWVSNPRPSPPPLMPVDWTHRWGADCWLLWQNKWMVKFTGCPGTIDFNKFNGDINDYCLYFGLPVPPTPPPPVPIEPVVPIARVELLTAYQYANCRAGPGTQYADIGDLSRGAGSKTRTVVPVTAETADWYKVEFFVAKSHTRKV